MLLGLLTNSSSDRPLCCALGTLAPSAIQSEAGLESGASSGGSPPSLTVEERAQRSILAHPRAVHPMFLLANCCLSVLTVVAILIRLHLSLCKRPGSPSRFYALSSRDSWKFSVHGGVMMRVRGDPRAAFALRATHTRACVHQLIRG